MLALWIVLLEQSECSGRSFFTGINASPRNSPECFSLPTSQLQKYASCMVPATTDTTLISGPPDFACTNCPTWKTLLIAAPKKGPSGCWRKTFVSVRLSTDAVDSASGGPPKEQPVQVAIRSTYPRRVE